MITIARKGRYQEWLTEDGLLRIQGWARDGLTDQQIANNIRITTTTLYDWINKFPAIAYALKKGKAPVDTEVENSLLKRAMGYDWEETTTEIRTDPDGKQTKHMKKVTRHVPADTLAIIFWLKNRKPKQWREKRNIEDADDSEVLKNAKEILQGVKSVIE